MNTETTTSELTDAAKGAWTDVQNSLREQYDGCEKAVRESPMPSVLVATLAGFVLHLLPIGALFAGIVRLALALVRPAILIFGAAKLFEFLKTQSASNGSASAAPRMATEDRFMP